jgi:hypothetical protein
MLPSQSKIAASLLPVAGFAIAVAILAAAPGLAAFAEPAFRLNINTVDSGGAPIAGYYVVLSQSGAVVGSGFSPAEFSLNDGQEYVVSVADYGDYAFDHWLDSGSSGRDRQVTLSSDASLTAVYRNLNGNPGSPPDEEEPPAEQTQSTVTIRTVDSASSEIFGYYVILSKDGAVIGTGFSPAEFALIDGQQYSVSVSDYGSYYFDHWQDSGDSRERTVTTSSSEYVAVYSTDQAAPPPDDTDPPEEEEPPVSGQSVLTVRTQAGSEISGYWTVLSKGGAVVATGFSPAQFTLDNGQNYVVSVSDYGDFAFDHWQDTGSETRDRGVSLSGNTEVVAIYAGPDGEVPDEEPIPPEDPQDPPVSGQSTITINTAGPSGAISGYYVTLSQNGAVIDSGFSPKQFTVNNGQAYAVSVSDYGNYAFDHWEDGPGSRERTVSVTQNAQFTAVYENINGGSDPDPEQPPSPPGTPGSITVYAYRMASPWWGPTFSGAGANMFFTLYDSSFAVVATAFVDENGHVFVGLNNGQTYYVYPADCDGCHNTNHDVKFRHWENGSTERPRAVVAGSAGVGAYFEFVPWT